MKTIRRYSELAKFSTMEDRYRYLKLPGMVGIETFGFDRYLNQVFYHSPQWKRTRQLIIIRDNGCDLGVDGFEIRDRVLIHHINPLEVTDIRNDWSKILDPEYLICTSRMTHQAIHYGDKGLLPQVPITRRPGDTKLW
jgi:hypothetical protein